MTRYRMRLALCIIMGCLGVTDSLAASWPPPVGEPSRFLPGLYYFHAGCAEFQRGGPTDTANALALWKIAAYWASKTAQYDLGIAYFKGQGVAADRPLGIAWLALAAERHDSQFEDSLAAAWDQSSVDERDRANALWRDMRWTYSDKIARVRAQRRFDAEKRNITGSHVGSLGPVTIDDRTGNGPVDGATYIAEMDRKAKVNFGKLGTVKIGPLVPVIDAPQLQKPTPGPGG